MYAKEHDILKLCSNSKIHYCPEHLEAVLNKPEAFENLRKQEWYKALRHHCFFNFWRDSHDEKCRNKPPYPVQKEFLLITLADWLASSISRRLRRGRRGHWEVFKVWQQKWKDEKEKNGRAFMADDSIYIKLSEGKNISELFEEKKMDLRKRAEDALHCPFASLLTHSELTEKWFEFLLKNSSYFGFPDNIMDRNQARKYIIDALSEKIRKGRISRPIFFLRVRIVPNEKISRLADTQIIYESKNVLDSIAQRITHSQELYKLYDELLLVVAPQGLQDDKNLIGLFEERLRKEVWCERKFTTNYCLEFSISKSYLTKANKNESNFLNNFDKLFGEFQKTLYPELQPTITAYNETDDESASAAILCELCQLAQARHTYYKEKGDIPKVKEHLCDSCFQLRQQIDRQDSSKGKLGKDFAGWEEEESTPYACFVYVSLDLTKLNQTLKDSFAKDLDFYKREPKLRDQDLGFSILSEFLAEYKSFVEQFIEGVLTEEQYRDQKNYIKILPNFICLKMHTSADIKQVTETFAAKHKDFFPKWTTTETPIMLSISYGNVKYPFFEHWRYLKSKKIHPMNILLVRNAHLEMDFKKYDQLTRLDLENRRISALLHNIAAIEERTGNELLVKVAILERRRDFERIFQYFTTGEITARDILAYYKIFKKPKLSEVR